MANEALKKAARVQWLLIFYDLLVFIAFAVLSSIFPSTYYRQDLNDIIIEVTTLGFTIFLFRFIFGVYRRIWRFEGVSGYLILIFSDIFSLLVYWPIYSLLPIQQNFMFVVIAMGLFNCLASITIRLLYRYFYKNGIQNKVLGKIFWPFIRFVSWGRIQKFSNIDSTKINIAVVGAGRTGESFAYDLLNNPAAYYYPKLFIDNNEGKIGKNINGIKVYPEDKNIFNVLRSYNVKEIVIATPNLTLEQRQRLFKFYRSGGWKVKAYDYPTTITANSKRHLRDFDIQDLMPRRQAEIASPELVNFYRNKVVLITGGGGSIGSEMARQVYKMKASKLILLDVYENGVYDLQQELFFFKAEDAPQINVEICNIADEVLLEKVFAKYKPDIVIHAAAHKHVPLMEDNVCEAIKNNIFGTYNVVCMSEKYNVQKFMMVSTDKAVNPTNVMGATKRFSEMIVKAQSTTGKVRYGSTRFGNVLGSSGSVVPLFRMQIANGGPVTVTDKRIVRYFMTIPEACNLVLQASMMTDNGELFVLDMGRPVKIWDLAQNMIEIAGTPDIKIVETGLRPGEKLYEELLLKDSDKHDKTTNDQIFIEREQDIVNIEHIKKCLNNLENACKDGDNAKALAALRKAVPEFKDPQEVNAKAAEKLDNHAQDKKTDE